MLLIIEVMAASWYAISYIPFGRKIVIAFLRRTICKPCFQVYDSVKGTQGGGKAGGGGGGMASQSELWWCTLTSWMGLVVDHRNSGLSILLSYTLHFSLTWSLLRSLFLHLYSTLQKMSCRHMHYLDPYIDYKLSQLARPCHVLTQCLTIS